MTERKAFKRRVRAQMDTTGQSYAQAAAQLEAGNPARGPDAHPASAIVVALLRASGIMLDPVAAFGIGGGIGFMYAMFRYREIPHPLLTLVCQHHPEPWAPAILRRLEIGHAERSGKRELSQILGEDRPLILPVAREALPWLEADPLTAHEEHIVLALPDGEGVRLFDGQGAHAPLPKANVADGYAATRRKHPLITIDDGARAAVDVDGAITAGLRSMIAGMTDPVLGNAFDINFGIGGLRRWADRVADPGPDGWRRAFDGSDVWQRRLKECIDLEHTAPTAGRPLFARLLRQAGYPEGAAHFDRSGAHWRAIGDAAGQGRLRLDDLALRVAAIAEDETHGVAVVREELGSTF